MRGTGATSVSLRNPNWRSHEQAQAGEDRRKQDGHADDARRDELKVAAIAGALEDRTEPESKHEEIEHGLAERRNDLRARAGIAFQFAQP